MIMLQLCTKTIASLRVFRWPLMMRVANSRLRAKGFVVRSLLVVGHLPVVLAPVLLARLFLSSFSVIAADSRLRAKGFVVRSLLVVGIPSVVLIRNLFARPFLSKLRIFAALLSAMTLSSTMSLCCMRNVLIVCLLAVEMAALRHLRAQSATQVGLLSQALFFRQWTVWLDYRSTGRAGGWLLVTSTGRSSPRTRQREACVLLAGRVCVAATLTLVAIVAIAIIAGQIASRVCAHNMVLRSSSTWICLWLRQTVALVAATLRRRLRAFNSCLTVVVTAEQVLSYQCDVALSPISTCGKSSTFSNSLLLRTAILRCAMTGGLSLMQPV